MSDEQTPNGWDIIEEQPWYRKDGYMSNQSYWKAEVEFDESNTRWTWSVVIMADTPPHKTIAYGAGQGGNQWDCMKAAEDWLAAHMIGEAR